MLKKCFVIRIACTPTPVYNCTTLKKGKVINLALAFRFSFTIQETSMKTVRIKDIISKILKILLKLLSHFCMLGIVL